MHPVSNEIGRSYYFAFVRPSVRLFFPLIALKHSDARVLKFYIWVPHGFPMKK